MALLSSSSAGHRWHFFRAGGLDMVRLESADDLRHLATLDQKLWTALACPVKGLEFDEKTLALIDTDKDGRVRVPEIIAAVDWVCTALHDPAAIFSGSGSATLPLAAIADATILASAKEILSSLGRPAADSISLADATDTARIFAQTKFNGDGVVPPAAAGDRATEQVMLDIIATEGGVPDRSGAPGVDRAKVEAFFADLAAFDAWTKQAEADAKTVLPLGANTGAALAALVAVRAKVNDYFARCRLATFDARATSALNRQESEFLALAAKDLTISSAEIAAFPLAHVEAGRALPLHEGLNPAWAGAIGALRDFVVGPLLGAERTALSESDWAQLESAFAAYERWSAARAGATVETLGIQRVRELLATNVRETIAALIVRDQALEPQFNAIASVERLVRYHRDLHRLLLNFVSFADFYSPDRLAIFQAGTLYLDSRACDLVVRVDDAAKHAALGGLAKAYLAYCDCTRASGEKMTIAAAFMNGDADRLLVGRNGVFYDRKGRDWDATITRIVENPISIREAFWSPYKKFVRMIEEQVARRAAAADAASQSKLTAAAAATANADKTARPAEPPKKVDVGMVAALGVAFGSIGTFLAAILTRFVDLGPWIPIGFVGVILLISGPSMLIAALKLRQRNLGPILDANGWAVNGRVKINIPLGTSLTAVAKIPPGSHRTLSDPYAEKKSPWRAWLIFLLVLGLGAVAIRWDHNRRGRYFWQPAPPPPAAPAAPAAPDTSAPPAPESPAAPAN